MPSARASGDHCRRCRVPGRSHRGTSGPLSSALESTLAVRRRPPVDPQLASGTEGQSGTPASNGNLHDSKCAVQHEPCFYRSVNIPLWRGFHPSCVPYHSRLPSRSGSNGCGAHARNADVPSTLAGRTLADGIQYRKRRCIRVAKGRRWGQWDRTDRLTPERLPRQWLHGSFPPSRSASDCSTRWLRPSASAATPRRRSPTC